MKSRLGLDIELYEIIQGKDLVPMYNAMYKINPKKKKVASLDNKELEKLIEECKKLYV